MRSSSIAIVVFIMIVSMPSNLIADEQKILNVLGDYKFYVSSEDIRHEMINDDHITILGFIVGKHSLLDVQNELGEVDALPRKEHAPEQICYVSVRPSERTIIIFESGPLGGWKYLTAFSLVSEKSDFKYVQLCKKTSLVSPDIATKSGLKLGMSKEDLMAIMGKPSKIIDDNYFYLYDFQSKMTPEEIKLIGSTSYPYFDVSSAVFAKFDKSKLIEITISKVESY